MTCSSPDIYIRQGDNSPRVIIQFNLDLTGSDLTLQLRWRGGSMTLTTENNDLAIDGITDPITQQPAWRVIWAYSSQQADMIPVGRLTRYLLQRRVAGGETRVYADGILVGLTGVV